MLFWVVLGHYWTVQPWSPSFNAADKTVGSVVAWVRFPGMPIQYYNKSVLRAISEVVGKFIRVDYNTEEAQRGKFARVAVEINLSKPLVSQFLIDGSIQRVEYEDLPVICFKCGKYGHTNEFCKENESVDPRRDDRYHMAIGTTTNLEGSMTGMEVARGDNLATGNSKLNPLI